MKKYLLYLLFMLLIFCLASCGNDKEDEPDFNLVNNSLDPVIANLNGTFVSSWKTSTHIETYTITFSPYSAPINKDITTSNGSSVNFTTRVRMFGRVNVKIDYTFESTGYSYEYTNKDYVYGMESTPSTEPYKITFYPYSSSDGDDVVYGLSSNYEFKSITASSFEMAVNTTYHLFKK